MREIKFRVWYKYRDLNSRQWTGIHYLDWLEIISGGLDYPAQTGVWMQYTGLKDKNGKEIYEGDILNSPGGSPTPANTVVVFEEGKFKAVAGNYTINVSKYWSELSVDGNIYENPELLEK